MCAALGPPVKIPQKSGFGSELISAAIEGNLGGKTHAEWNESGLKFIIELDYEEACRVDESS